MGRYVDLAKRVGERKADGESVSAKPAGTPLSTVEVLAVPLSRFAREGRLVEVAVPWWEESLFFVPGSAEAEALRSRGVRRGRVWTAAELADLLSLPGLTAEAVETVGRVKAALQAEILSVEPEETEPLAADVRPTRDHEPAKTFSPPRRTGPPPRRTDP